MTYFFQEDNKTTFIGEILKGILPKKQLTT
jgi:hypothetical protein